MYTYVYSYINIYIYIYLTLRVHNIYTVYVRCTHIDQLRKGGSQKLIVICAPGLGQASNEETSTRGSVVYPADSALSRFIADHIIMCVYTICICTLYIDTQINKG